ncbi:MAG: YdbH domain-containing protein [Rhodospirillaceae bacterium]|nr:YdbH domain-containing protein [Rhodospirillaceae bacterium]
MFIPALPAGYPMLEHRWVRYTIKGLLWTLAAVLLLAGLATVFAAPIAEVLTAKMLEQRGFGPSTLHVAKLGLDGVSVRNLSTLGGAVKLAEADIAFSIGELRTDKRIDALRIDGLQAKLVWSADGRITVGDMQIYPRPPFADMPSPQAATPPEPGQPTSFHLRSLVVGNSQLILGLPETEIATTLNATFINDAATGRALDATLNSAGDNVQITAGASMVQAPGKAAQGAGSVTYKLGGLNLPTLATGLSGEGNVSVSFDADGARTQDSRADLTLALVTPPPALAAVGVKGDTPVRLALEGNNSRLFLFTLDQTKATPTATVDGALTLKTGSVDLRAEVQGWTDVPLGGAIPQDFHITQLNLIGKGLSFGGGAGSASLNITDFKGPIAVAEGRISGQVLGSKLTLADRAEAKFAAAMRLDGLSLSFDLSEAFAEAENLKLGSAVAAGVSRVALTDAPKTGPSSPQQVNLVLGASRTLAVDMVMTGSLPKILTSPGATPAVLTLPRITLSGYISQGPNTSGTAARTGAIKLAATDGRLTHGFAHLGDITADLAIDGKKVTGPVKAVLQEAPGPTRPSALDRRGAVFKSNLTIDSESIDFKGNILSRGDVDVGDYSFTQQSDQPPVISLSIPARTWASEPSFIEVFGPIAGLTNTTGTFGLDLRATPSKAGLDGTLKLAFADFGFTLGSMTVTGLNSVMALNQIWPPKAALPQRISFGQLVAGVPFQNGDITVALNGDTMARVSQAGMRLAGGSVTGADFVVPLDGSTRSFAMNVANVDLEGLVKAFTTDGLTATGKLSGTLPLRLQNSRLYIEKGKLVGQNGSIQYRPTQPPAALAQGGGTILLQALENFEFTEVTANINGDVIKDLGIGLTLKGKNPGLYGGYPIEFNLNLDGPLNQLVREGLSGYRIPEDIKQRLQQQGINAPK